MINTTTTTLIAIEGLDCSFKETNSKLLQKKLEEDGYLVGLIDFPQYERESSYFVRQFLRDGRYRDERYRDKKETIKTLERYALFYTLDRYDTFVKKIKPLMGTLDVIIFDRYVISNLYQCARLVQDGYTGKDIVNDNDIADLEKTIMDSEYNQFCLPKEDMAIFLKMPYEISRIIRSNKADKDLNEIDEKFQEKLYLYYERYFESSIKNYIIDHPKGGYFVKSSDCYTNVNKYSINLYNEAIDYEKSITDEEEREKSKRLNFDRILACTYNDIINTINRRRKEYEKEE